MPGSAFIEVESAGAERRLAGVAERLAYPELGFGVVMREFEETERTIFESYGGKYVKTGALEASLTEASAIGAVRALRPTGFDFGSSVFYGQFQGTTGPGRHRPPSAIMKLTPGEVLAAEKTLLEFVMHGGAV